MSKEPLELLESIDYPRDLRRLTPEQLPQLCRELRTFLIQELSDNPGHLASSLGVVELTVALHYVFDTPEDRIVWDVGHQAYGHKILTGRRELFHENRKMDGLRPFPSPEESEYDTNTCGHASNSISVALGMAVAAEQQHIDRHVVAVIGDGSMSGGLAFEGLNNVSSTPNNMLIILNDNNMSIDSAVGGLKQYLHNLHTSSFYNELRNKAALKLGDWGWMNDERRRSILRFNNSLKSLIQGQRNIFEGLDIRYFGPEDGHDIGQLVETLRRIKDMKGYAPPRAKATNRRRRTPLCSTLRAASTPRRESASRATPKGCPRASRTSSDAHCWHWPGKTAASMASPPPCPRDAR